MRISDWSSDVCSSDLVGDVAPTYAIRVSCPFAMPMRPPVGRGYAPDTRAVSKAVAPMANACDPRTKVRTKSRRARSTVLREPSVPPHLDRHASRLLTGQLPTPRHDPVTFRLTEPDCTPRYTPYTRPARQTATPIVNMQC